MVVGFVVGVREQGFSFIERPNEAAQAYYDRGGPPESLVKRSFGGILAQIEYEPDPLAGDLREAFKKRVILDRYHPDAATHYAGQIQVPTQAVDDLRDAMCLGARAIGTGGEEAFLAERYEKKTVVITSNLVFSQWDQIFKNPMTTMAAIDRLVHHATILEFTGESIRANAAKKRQN